MAIDNLRGQNYNCGIKNGFPEGDNMMKNVLPLCLWIWWRTSGKIWKMLWVRGLAIFCLCVLRAALK